MKTKKIISLFVVSFLLLSTFTVFASDRRTASDELLLEARMLVERTSQYAFDNIMSFKISGDDIEYHNNYGGAYLNEDGKLVILIALSDSKQPTLGSKQESDSNILSTELKSDSELFGDKSTEFKVAALGFKYMSGVKDSRDILFQEAQYSYSYLTALMNQLNNAYIDNIENPESIWYQVKGMMLLDNMNVISIGILDIDDAKMERFKTEVIDSMAITFENSDGLASPHATQNFLAGQQVNLGSIGFRAKRVTSSGTMYGFVTAGHVISTNQQARWGNAIHIGNCVVSINSTLLDGAFVRTDLVSNQMSNKTAGGFTMASTNTNPLNGSTIILEGKETKRTIGVIRSTNATLPYAPVRTGLISADIQAKTGDSGGIAYDGSNRVLGILIGGGTTINYFEKLTTLQTTLNVTFY